MDTAAWHNIRRQIDALRIDTQIENLRSQLAADWHFRLARHDAASAPIHCRTSEPVCFEHANC